MITRRSFLTNASTLLAAASLPPALWPCTAATGQDASSTIPLLLGVDYYPDQTPESLWEEDARMIAEVGFTAYDVLVLRPM